MDERLTYVLTPKPKLYMQVQLYNIMLIYSKSMNTLHKVPCKSELRCS